MSRKKKVTSYKDVNWREQEQKDGINDAFRFGFVTPNIFRIKENKCEECESIENLEIHHTRYDLMTINTLRLWCKGCHRKEDWRREKIKHRFTDFDVLWTCFITTHNKSYTKDDSKRKQ